MAVSLAMAAVLLAIITSSAATLAAPVFIARIIGRESTTALSTQLNTLSRYRGNTELSKRLSSSSRKANGFHACSTMEE